MITRNMFDPKLLKDKRVRNRIVKWVSALRSGKFKQGRYCLHNEELGSYCCLGVANKVCKLNELGTQVLHAKYKLIGLSASNGSFVTSEKDFALSAMNDHGGFTFDEIANTIEQHYNECLKTIEGEQNG